MTDTTERAALASSSRRATIVNGLRWLAVVVVFAFTGYALAGHWGEFWATVSGIPVLSSTLSLVMVIGSIALTVYGWQIVLNDLGKPIGYGKGAQIYLVGQLGKYVPGSVWGYLLQMELGKKAGLARARVFTASLLHLGIVLVSAMVVGLIALPVIFETSPRARWMLVLLPIGLIALHPKVLSWGASLVLRVLRRPGLARPLRWPTVGRILTASGAAKVLHGVHLWLLANTVGTPGWFGLVLCIGAMSLAMTAGSVAFIFPAGVGAREVVITAVLVASGIGAVQAAAIAAVSRVMFIVADLITAGGSAITARAALATTTSPAP